MTPSPRTATASKTGSLFSARIFATASAVVASPRSFLFHCTTCGSPSMESPFALRFSTMFIQYL